MEISQEPSQEPRWLSLAAAVRHYETGTLTTPSTGTEESLIALIDAGMLAGRHVPGRFQTDPCKVEVRADGLALLIDRDLDAYRRRDDAEAELAS